MAHFVENVSKTALAWSLFGVTRKHRAWRAKSREQSRWRELNQQSIKEQEQV